MTNELAKNFLKAHGVYSLEKSKQLIETVNIVSEIPWGDGRAVEEVLSTKKVGTCTGKHLVLQACLDELNIKYTPVVCTFHWGDQPIRYPENLRRILEEGEWEHGHNFVQIEKDGGQTIDIDITWNSKLKPYGFKTFPKNWNGKDVFIGVDKIIRRWDGADIRNMKKELIESLSPVVRARRERFLKQFIQWIGSINS